MISITNQKSKNKICKNKQKWNLRHKRRYYLKHKYYKKLRSE